jgi:hypothetical protein
MNTGSQRFRTKQKFTKIIIQETSVHFYGSGKNHSKSGIFSEQNISLKSLCLVIICNITNLCKEYLKKFMHDSKQDPDPEQLKSRIGIRKKSFRIHNTARICKFLGILTFKYFAFMLIP